MAITLYGSKQNIIQVVQTYDTTLRSTTTIYPTSSGLSATITPSASTSKILVCMNVQMYVNGGTNTNHIGVAGIARGTTLLISQRMGANLSANSSDAYVPTAITYLDSPSTTSAVTYNFYWGNWSGSGTYNCAVSMNDGNNGNFTGNQGSTITLLEVIG